jgi:hypothetical protein
MHHNAAVSAAATSRKRTQRQLAVGLGVFLLVNALAFAGTIGLYVRNREWLAAHLGRAGSAEVKPHAHGGAFAPLGRALSAAAGSLPLIGRRLQADGPAAAATKYPGERLVFDDEFDRFDLSLWKHDITMNGGGNNEFQF